MSRLRNIIFNTSFVLNCLLLFLIAVESKIVVPAWLQVIGRMHPLMLHFPVTLLILCILWFLFIERKIDKDDISKTIGDWLLLLTAFTAALTAVMGLLLSKENGYDADALLWHKWSGISVSLIAFAWYVYRQKLRQVKALNITVCVISFTAIVFAGHEGADITHGENFLLAPITPEKQTPGILLEDAHVYADMVKPILQNKCMSCHNSKKAKGDLAMETEALLLKGGKHGKLWGMNETDYGLLLQRVYLSEENKKHMPPAGKPQLSDDELQILYYWIKEGADFKKKVTDLPEQDTLRLLASSLFNTIETDDYDFEAADEKTIKALNTNYRVIYPLAQESPALGVDFYGAQVYQSKDLEKLLKIKDNIVSLNLNKMPVKDDELKTIAQFTNLRKLNLSFTSVTGKTITELTKLTKLKHLSLSGTALKLNDINALLTMKSLTKLYIWNTNIKDEDVKKLSVNNKQLTIETGYTGDTSVLKLNPPIIKNEEQIIDTPVALNLKHYINGVTIRYTLDGSEPDSLHSPVYDKNVMLTKTVTVKAKAYKQGWISSDIVEDDFYSAKIKPDTVINILPPDEQYKGGSSNILIDLEKGESNNFKSGKWLGYRNNRMESVFDFKQPQTVSSVTISTLIDIGSYIMPPAQIEIWGAGENGVYKKIKSLTPQQPTAIQPAFLKGFEISFEPVILKSVKVIAVPVGKLPAWHPGKGDKGWVFVDEVFFN